MIGVGDWLLSKIPVSALMRATCQKLRSQRQTARSFPLASMDEPTGPNCDGPIQNLSEAAAAFDVAKRSLEFAAMEVLRCQMGLAYSGPSTDQTLASELIVELIPVMIGQP